MRDAINEIAREHPGKPSSKIIRRRLGSIGKALEFAGLFDFQRFDHESYLDWGVKFYLANDGIAPDRTALDHLSPQRLAPSRSAITRNFGSIESFRLEVEPRYIEERGRLEEQKRRTFSAVMQSLADKSLPAEIICGADDPTSMFRSYGIYKVIEKLAPGIEAARKTDISQSGSVQRMMNEITKAGDGAITVADIEESAEMLGVFDYLWPTDRFMQTLRLPYRI